MTRIEKAIGVCAAMVVLFADVTHATAQRPEPLVRIAELEIDPAQVEQYKAALREEIQTSVREEPGVISLYAVALKGEPAKVRLLEIYADDTACQSHLASSHFKRYKTATQGMVTSLKLLETEPILLGSR